MMKTPLHVRTRRFTSVAAATLLIGGTAAIVGFTSPPASGESMSSQCPWLDPSLPTEQRVDMLVSHMTLEQQVSLMTVVKGGDYAKYQVHTNPIPELCLPAITQGDGPDRVRRQAVGATAFPAPIALGATFDRSLATDFGDALGAEFHGKGVMMAHAPSVNLARVPEWGRIWETFGEDTYLTTQLSNSEIEAVQSQGVIADVKHIAEYNQEANVHVTATNPHDNVLIDKRTMMETELSIFESAFRDAHAGAGMCAFTEINGVPACQSPDVMSWLRNDVGFKGMIRADGAPGQKTPITDLPAAVSVGMDQSSWSTDTIMADVSAGEISPAEIATAAKHILLPVFEARIMDKPWAYTPDADVSTPAHQQTALTIAERGAVLLRNQSNVLPLSADNVKSIAVIGAGASTDIQSSTSPDTVTPLQGITDRAGSGVGVSYVEGDHTGNATTDAASIQAAADAARSADVAVVFVGVGGSEGQDLRSATLSGDGVRTDQDQLIQAVAQANPDTVVVLNTANPVLMPWNDQVAGIIEAWRPGQVDGTAIAHLLFGDVNPSGKLPLTFPASADQSLSADPNRYPGVNWIEEYSEGLNLGYKWYDANGLSPLFPFGYGLSYTQFAFKNLKITPANSRGIDANRAPNRVVTVVHASVTNTGTRTGAEVAQLYLGDPSGTGEPVRQLRGFQRVTLAPGQTQQVAFPLTARDLAYWNTASRSWTVAPGAYQVYVGDSSAVRDLPLYTSFHL